MSEKSVIPYVLVLKTTLNGKWVWLFNYVIYHFSDYGYKHANGIDGPCIRDNTIILPNTCTSNVTSYIKSQGLVTMT